MERWSGQTAVVLGGLMIVVGALALVSRALRVPDVPVDALWPLLVLLPGALLFAGGVIGRLILVAVPGAIVSTVGLLLLYQNTTGHWQSWAYAWALVVPAAIGVAQLVVGSMSGDRNLARIGNWMLVVGIGLFVTGVVVFEGLFGLSGWDLGPFGGVGVPVLLILFGVALVVRRGGSSQE